MSWTRTARVWSFAIVAIFFAIVLAYADLGKVAHAFSGIRWQWAILVPILNLANTFVEALRLSVILFPMKKELRVLNCFNSTLIGIIGNVMLPLRFGDGARAYYLARTEKIGLSRSLSAVALDRVADFLLFFILMALTAVFHPFPPSVTRMGIAAGSIFAVTIAVIFIFARLGLRLGAGNSAGKIRRRIAEELNKFVAGLAVMRNAGLLFPVLALSALSWFLRAGMIWVMFEAFALELPLMATPVTLILLNFGIAAVGTPANIGGFELATVGALKLFSVEIEVALSYALALHVLEVVPIMLFGSAFLWLEGFKAGEVLRSAKKAEFPDANNPAAPPVDPENGVPTH